MRSDTSRHVPSVSTVLPLLRWEEHTEEAIGSVLDQRFDDLELIIVAESRDVLAKVGERSQGR